jgi:hypothetical protein
MPAAATYEPISTTTLSSSNTSHTFSSIPSTYTDLIIVISNQATSGGVNPFIQYNGDTGANYSDTRLYAYGTGSGGAYDSSFLLGDSTTSQNTFIVHIMNYANTTTFKTAISRGSVSDSSLTISTGLWRSTAAITSVKINQGGGVSFASGSTFTLYGIKAA